MIITWINLLTGTSIILVGILVKTFPDLIAGYNTLSEEKKAKVDIKGLSSMIMKSLIVLGILIILGHYVFTYFNLTGLANVAIILFTIPVIPYIIIKAQQYNHNEGTSNKKNKVILIFVGVIIFVTVGIAYDGFKPPTISLSNNHLEFSGLYGISLDLNQVEKIELTTSIPKILRKTNGFNFGNVYRGAFALDAIGNCQLNLFSAKGPFIVITTKNQNVVIINLKSEQKTRNLYSKLMIETNISE